MPPRHFLEIQLRKWIEMPELLRRVTHVQCWWPLLLLGSQHNHYSRIALKRDDHRGTHLPVRSGMLSSDSGHYSARLQIITHA